MDGEINGSTALRERVIVVARASRDIRRDYRFHTSAASSEFLRAWWAGVHGFQPSGAMGARYQAGYAAGLAWRTFHGRGRRPHETHALDALRLDREMPDVAEELRRFQETSSALDGEGAGACHGGMTTEEPLDVALPTSLS